MDATIISAFLHEEPGQAGSRRTPRRRETSITGMKIHRGGTWKAGRSTASSPPRQCPRLKDGGRHSSRGRERCLRRLGLYGQDGSDREEGAPSAGSYPDPRNEKQETHRRRERNKPSALEDKKPWRAHLPHREEDLRVFEGQVQGSGEEQQLRLCALCAVEPVHGSQGPAVVDRGVVYPTTGKRPSKTRNSVKRHKKAAHRA